MNVDPRCTCIGGRMDDDEESEPMVVIDPECPVHSRVVLKLQELLKWLEGGASFGF